MSVLHSARLMFFVYMSLVTLRPTWEFFRAILLVCTYPGAGTWLKVPVKGPSGEFPAVDTRTNGHSPHKITPKLLQWKHAYLHRNILRKSYNPYRHNHTAPQAVKPVCPPLFPLTTQLQSCKSNHVAVAT